MRTLIFASLLAALAIGRGRGQGVSSGIIRFQELNLANVRQWSRCKQPCMTHGALYGECEAPSRCSRRRLRLSRAVTKCNRRSGSQARVCCPWVEQGSVRTLKLCGRLCVTKDKLYGVCRPPYRCPASRQRLTRKRTLCRTPLGTGGEICCPFRQRGVKISNPDFTFDPEVIITDPVTGRDFTKPDPRTECGRPTSKKSLSYVLRTGRVRRIPLRSSRGSVLKIISGRRAGVGKWPWIALLGLRNNSRMIHWLCGATLINKQHVLTAAHCFDLINRRDTASLLVRLGEFDRTRTTDGPSEDYSVERYILHHRYVPYQNDIAVVKLASPLHFTDFIKPLCLPARQTGDLAGRRALVAGWGRTRKEEVSAILMELSVPVIGSRKCEAIYKAAPDFNKYFRGGFRNTKICAGGEKNKDTCHRDSGGPLMLSRRNGRYMLVGIVSVGGSSCGQSHDVPTIYTRVSTYLNWIRKHTK